MAFTVAFQDDDEEELKSKLLAACPIVLTVHETTVRMFPIPPYALLGVLMLIAECEVADPAGMTATPHPFIVRYSSLDDEIEAPAPMAVCPEIELLELRAEEVCGAFSLMYRRPFRLGHTMLPFAGPGQDSEFLPEDEEDAAVLKRLGHPVVESPLLLALGDSTVGEFGFSEELVGRLAERSGIRVYWEAVFAQSAVARFRDLWRTLESAFGAQGRQLRERLLALPATVELGFDADELTDYEILRGRASHASDRGGHREAAIVQRLARERVGRLQALVERVLLTKAEDDDRSTIAVDELLPFRGDRAPEDFNRSPLEEPIRRDASNRS